jgi:hypothetical protein
MNFFDNFLEKEFWSSLFFTDYLYLLVILCLILLSIIGLLLFIYFLKNKVIIYIATPIRAKRIEKDIKELDLNNLDVEPLVKIKEKLNKCIFLKVYLCQCKKTGCGCSYRRKIKCCGSTKWIDLKKRLNEFNIETIMELKSLREDLTDCLKKF